MTRWDREKILSKSLYITHHRKDYLPHEDLVIQEWRTMGSNEERSGAIL